MLDLRGPTFEVQRFSETVCCSNINIKSYVIILAVGKEVYRDNLTHDRLSSSVKITWILSLMCSMGIGAWLGIVSREPIKLRVDEATCNTVESEIIGNSILDPSKADELLTVLKLPKPDIAIIYQNGEFLIKCGDYLTNTTTTPFPKDSA